MTKWMATLTFKERPTAEVLALIPQEQAHVKQMIADKQMEAIFISNQTGQAWLVVYGDSEEAVSQTLTTLPMHAYFKIEIAPLQS